MSSVYVPRDLLEIIAAFGIANNTDRVKYNIVFGDLVKSVPITYWINYNPDVVRLDSIPRKIRLSRESANKLTNAHKEHIYAHVHEIELEGSYERNGLDVNRMKHVAFRFMVPDLDDPYAYDPIDRLLGRNMLLSILTWIMRMILRE
jgi:hypothetical protein